MIIIIHTFFAAALELPSVSPFCVVTSIPSLSSWFLISITFITLAVAEIINQRVIMYDMELL